MKTNFSEPTLIAHIKAGGINRQNAIAQIYRDKTLKNQILSFVKKHSGNVEDGIDIFHEGIMALDENIRNDKFKGEGKLNAYLFSICKLLWYNKLKRNKRMIYTPENTQLDQVSEDNPETISLLDEQKTIIAKLLGQLGDKCRKILELWKLSYSMEEIAEEVGLDNAGIARRQRYNCYQKLLQIVDQEPNLRDILK